MLRYAAHVKQPIILQDVDRSQGFYTSYTNTQRRNILQILPLIVLTRKFLVESEIISTYQVT